MNTTQLAKELGVSKGRISQYVSEGKLDGCFAGDGRSRRFDLAKVRAALDHGLDPGQMLGNGSETKRRLRDGGGSGEQPDRRDGELRRGDPDRYELARIQKVEEEARKLRRQNLLDEGSLVLADQAAREAGRALTKELAQIEDFLVTQARALADVLGVDFKEARKVLIDGWRDHRAKRAAALAAQGRAAERSAEEAEADF